MSQTTQEKWVAGIVNISPHFGKDHPYTFFEIDTIEKCVYESVLENYKKFNLDVVSQRIGKGFHFFGANADRQVWKEWYFGIKDFNYKWPPLTLRITKKKEDEIFERPIYHEAQSKPLDWSRSLMHFMNKVIRNENSTDLHQAMSDCGLDKYYKCVVYKVELK